MRSTPTARVPRKTAEGSVHSADVSTTSTDVLGRTVDGRYRVERLLAHGGMASVYVATDTRLHRRIALKVMRPDLARDSSFVERFRREARAAARLSHPNVVGVYDQGEDGELVFLVMELVNGQTLRDLIADQAPLSVRQALAVMDPVLAALEAAHRAGVAHRDIKPENVLIGSGETVKVADFGLARAIGTAAATSVSNDHTWGTAAYLSPEQVEHGHADTRSDVYSAALLLYELLTGAKAFPGDSPLQVAYQHVNGDLPRAGDTTPTVPAEMDALIQWAGARDPNRRPADAGAMRAALIEAVAQLSEEELSARPNDTQDHTAVIGGASDRAAAAGSRHPDLDRIGQPEPAREDVADATRPIRPDRTRMVPIPGATARPGHFARTTGNRPAARPARSRTSRSTSRPAAARSADAPGARRGTPAPAAGRDRTDPILTAAGSRRRRRRRVAGWTLGILLALISVTGATAAWYFTVGPGVYSATPDLIGQGADQARAAIEDVQLRPVLEQAYSEDVPAEQVIEQDPQPGVDLRHGSEVALTVSMGPERYEVPELVGRSEADARRLVEDANLAWAQPQEEFSEEVAAGEVISVEPEVGSPLPPDTEVTVTLSSGPQPIDVPAVVGSTEQAAREAIEAADLTVVIASERVNDDAIAAGSVVSQDPDSGTLSRGEEVTLTLSDGPELIEVPNMFGRTYSAAEEELTELGFVVERTDISGGVFGLVRDQSVSTGEMVPRGTVITLSVI